MDASKEHPILADIKRKIEAADLVRTMQALAGGDNEPLVLHFSLLNGGDLAVPLEISGNPTIYEYENGMLKFRNERMLQIIGVIEIQSVKCF